MTRRSGATSLAELILVTWLFALVLAGIARFLNDQNRLAALQRDRIRFEEAVRTATVVLGAELRYLAPGDIVAAAADSVRLRAFRGGGPVCSADGPTLWVRYRGARPPDAAKDSILLVGPMTQQVHRLVSAAGSGVCGGSLELRLDPGPGAGPAYALVFETGTYALADGAFRYRRGESGRQPLTEAIFGAMGFEVREAGLNLGLRPHPDSLPRLRDDHRALVFYGPGGGAWP